MTTQTAFIFTDAYFQFDYGPYHPLRMERLELAFELIQAYGLLDLPQARLLDTVPAKPEALASFHRYEYLNVLKSCNQADYDPEVCRAYGLGSGDNPVFPGVWDFALLTTGASLQCAQLVADRQVQVAFNMAGGLHHALPNRASGFCYVNDAAVAITQLVSRGLRVVYIDLDAHHGDGVQYAFEDTDQVLTISLHQHGRTLFPGTGFVYDTGKDRGQGYAANLPLPPGTGDDVFLQVFEGIVPDLVTAFQPDIMVTQLGVDTFRTDPLTNLCLTTNGFSRAVRLLKSMNLPWVALGGGGYHLVNVARAWTLAWAAMNDVEPPETLPESFLRRIRPSGYREVKLRDEPVTVEKAVTAEIETTARQVVESVRRTVLPVIAWNRNRS